MRVLLFCRPAVRTNSWTSLPRLSEQLKNDPGLAILEHPEDLGKVGYDAPGSIWQFESF